MKFNKLKIILVLFALTSLTYGQTLKDITNSLNHSKSWNTKLTYDSCFNRLIERNQVAKWTFTNEKNEIGFIVFKYSESDSIHFQEKITEYYAISSCRDFSATTLYNFNSFTKEGYYFLLERCHNCDVERNKKCRNLARKIFEWNLNLK